MINAYIGRHQPAASLLCDVFEMLSTIFGTVGISGYEQVYSIIHGYYIGICCYQ
jgi:hypothetical protein